MSQTQNSAPATRVVTGECRLSYVTVKQPRENDNGQLKYSLTVMIPKSDKDTLRRIKAAQKAAAEKGKDSKFGGKIPPQLRTTLHDADTEANRSGELYADANPEYAGHFIMSLSSSDKPGLFDSQGNAILDAGEVYSGCYGRVSMDFYPYSNSGNKGISAGLRGIQKTRDGEPFGAAPVSADEFGVFDNGETEEDETDDLDFLKD